ncbi:MAG: endonuclease/exonuclease/phosphatase family protein [Alphaproteobacteria bacterium]|nr:endonuclease/exonuclease/phosphatase family protein [Alphaproteobacteria bacterium]
MGLLIGVGGLIASRLGQLWIAFDVFAQFTLQFAIIAAAFLVGWFMPRARLLVAFLVIICGLLTIGLWPQVATAYLQRTTPVPAGYRAITVANFNTWYSNREVDAVRAEIERLNADIITLVEVGPNKKPMLEALKSRYPHQATCFTVDYCNLAILAKFPILDHQARVGWEGPPLMIAKFGPELGSLTVIAVHTIRFPHSRAQFRQVTALASMIEAMAGQKVVMGDFNATPFSRIITSFIRRTGLVRFSDLPTWPSHLNLPQVAIDHIFASPGIVLTSSQQVGEPSGSDHYPVTAGIAVPISP